MPVPRLSISFILGIAIHWVETALPSLPSIIRQLLFCRQERRWRGDLWLLDAGGRVHGVWSLCDFVGTIDFNFHIGRNWACDGLAVIALDVCTVASLRVVIVLYLIQW
jgi:hypothetical protein